MHLSLITNLFEVATPLISWHLSPWRVLVESFRHHLLFLCFLNFQS